MKKNNRKKNTLCVFDNCKNKRDDKRIYCSFHRKKITIRAFLLNLYGNMKKRVQGKHGYLNLYKNKPLVAKEVFLNWAQNHPTFLSLYKQWYMCNFNIKLTPSVNRIDSRRGYTLDNMEWLTFSQNCTLAHATRKLHQRRAIYNLLGVN